jgi:hypothetical protein
METKVILSCDDNPYYLDFWPLVSWVWREKMGIEPVLAHVGERRPTEEYGQVHTIPVDQTIPIHTQAQLSRMWYTHTEPETTWITGDIDMFPMSRIYWQLAIDSFGECDWTNLNSNVDYFPICYNIAKGKVFTDILEIESSFSDYCRKVSDSVEENFEHLPDNWHNDDLLSKWTIDEIYSSRKICEFRDSGGKVCQPVPMMRLNRRIDRVNWFYNKDMVKAGEYIDCHSLRPYTSYTKEIDELLELL